MSLLSLLELVGHMGYQNDGSNEIEILDPEMYKMVQNGMFCLKSIFAVSFLSSFILGENVMVITSRLILIIFERLVGL